MKEHFPDSGLANDARIHWLKIEAYVTRDAEMVEHIATELFEDSGLETLYNMWNVCALALRAVDVPASTVTALYAKAAAAVTDYPDFIKEDAKKFTREAGSLDEWMALRNPDPPKPFAKSGKKRKAEAEPAKIWRVRRRRPLHRRKR